MECQERLTFIVNGVSFDMIRVEGGTFMMGATSEASRNAVDEEKPTHPVTLSSFSMGETEVTQELWQAVMENNPSEFKGTNHPVENVSWNDCQEFIRKLNSLTSRNFHMPTEAEWEFAARGGNKSCGYKYSGSNNIGDVAWYTSNSRLTTHPVKQKKANELGIYDMSGNVWEWCLDEYSNSYDSSPNNNPNGPSCGTIHVLRGGSWIDNARSCRSSNRYYCFPEFRVFIIGLRLALSE